MAATPPLCDFGRPAIDARLPGVDGFSHSIFDQAGPKGLVLAFICNHCPYVKAVIARIVRDASDLRAHGVGFVAINSNDAGNYPQDSFENMKRFASQNALPFPYLHDEDQSVAKTYGAVCTPDFFGFNKDMRLQYRGRLDGSRKEIGPADLRRDLYEAMVMVAMFGKGPAEQQPSIGCSIKWKVSAFQV
ncbi:thioredoxin family protein [Sinorhizobium medicae]|uniref:Alkyl hydroperoxide reductase/ Thiol specific antioxidant/ Mal allergen n=1 Tax=Sinorhizobium medicae TaxID=110321 RepID=A0A508X1E3_9HYPH|nr:thioredoxin family protein [Sinorhizobium medicae]MDX0455209.1 redoxin domain-containing protein [Sinorhizobium medicae]MDX0514502.1 redoxin domain-containing protein [Sinorhizobium medicae]MDX0547246.1 redoxin domain-containing protein [Sinorhizobium medicae]MDX0634480.1 redoxin domain-containing protein [Sinorhizobium medicae]MDX0714969.1 redoxin domain-containing protein [Sinorhizobium medicae]